MFLYLVNAAVRCLLHIVAIIFTCYLFLSFFYKVDLFFLNKVDSCYSGGAGVLFRHRRSRVTYLPEHYSGATGIFQFVT